MKSGNEPVSENAEIPKTHPPRPHRAAFTAVAVKWLAALMPVVTLATYIFFFLTLGLAADRGAIYRFVWLPGLLWASLPALSCVLFFAGFKVKWMGIPAALASAGFSLCTVYLWPSPLRSAEDGAYAFAGGMIFWLSVSSAILCMLQTIFLYVRADSERTGN